jgi:hypothetical protein
MVNPKPLFYAGTTIKSYESPLHGDREGQRVRFIMSWSGSPYCDGPRYYVVGAQ